MAINFNELTFTENGAFAHNTTGSEVLNLFARIGGLRGNEHEVVKLWRSARAENAVLADNMALYARDIRNGGIGEREIGRTLFRELATIEPEKVRRNLNKIVECGRWDDLWVLRGTKVWDSVLAFMRKQFSEDIINLKQNKPISLLAKWMPSVNTSSKQTRALAREFCSYLGITECRYRKTLSTMRKYLEVVEVKMSANKFNEIKYSAVPSVAMTHYRSAFSRHDYERFDEYLSNVANGKEKINAGVTYPYELITPYTDHWWSGEDKVLEAQWKALPNYVEGNHNVVVMSDVSGSMEGMPMNVSVSLGIYFAERNTGAYKNLFMTFTDEPQLFNIDPRKSLHDKVKEVTRHTGYNTNLDGALSSLYEKAKEVGVAPEALVVISDGEIDWFISHLGVDGLEDLVEKWQRKYAEAGLKSPKIIMWNVASRSSSFVSTKANLGISFVSGSSAATFNDLTTLITKDAMTAMIEILTKPQFTWE